MPSVFQRPEIVPVLLRIHLLLSLGKGQLSNVARISWQMAGSVALKCKYRYFCQGYVVFLRNIVYHCSGPSNT